MGQAWAKHWPLGMSVDVRSALAPLKKAFQHGGHMLLSSRDNSRAPRRVPPKSAMLEMDVDM